jgi:hypothetical protein
MGLAGLGEVWTPDGVIVVHRPPFRRIDDFIGVRRHPRADFTNARQVRDLAPDAVPGTAPGEPPVADDIVPVLPNPEPDVFTDELPEYLGEWYPDPDAL